jgi:hypothetical protein
MAIFMKSKMRFEYTNVHSFIDIAALVTNLSSKAQCCRTKFTRRGALLTGVKPLSGKDAILVILKTPF